MKASLLLFSSAFHPVRITRTRPAQFSARPVSGQQYRGELDATREPGHRGSRLHHRLWHWKPPRSDHQSGLQAALLHDREPRYEPQSSVFSFDSDGDIYHISVCQPNNLI